MPESIDARRWPPLRRKIALAVAVAGAALAIFVLTPAVTRTLSVALIWLSTIPATAFPLLYARSPWRRSAVGRALMTLAVGIALLVDISVAFMVIGGSPRPWQFGVALVVYAWIFVALCRQLIVLVLMQNATVRVFSKRARHAKPHDTDHFTPSSDS